MEQTTADQPVDQDVPVRNFNGHGRPGAMAHRDAVICGHFAQQRLSLEHVCNKRYRDFELMLLSSLCFILTVTNNRSTTIGPFIVFTHTHTHLMALFLGLPGELVPER